MILEKGVLYLVPTPIGNLEDMTARALFVLRNVDVIAAEDTRVTGKLLKHFGIETPMLSYHEHNKKARSEQILGRLKAGESCALVSDAGMPVISDPGEGLIKDCYAQGIKVSPLPGPSAAVAALAASGQEAGRFTFEGFLSVAAKSRTEHLASLKEEKRTMIFYEAPHKLKRTLKDLYLALGDRSITLCREISKLYEEFEKTTLSEALKKYEEAPPRGEYVLVVAGAPEAVGEGPGEAELKERMTALMDAGLTRKAAAARLSEETGRRKNDLYALSLTPEE